MYKRQDAGRPDAPLLKVRVTRLAGGGTALWGDETCTIQNNKTVDNCQLAWLRGDDDAMDQALYTIIALVTGVATLSVLSGLDRGIKTLSQCAFSCGMIVMITIVFADNTWYILNVMVQTTGYYLQYVIQVGFDCEAFQQLGYEFRSSNLLWGSDDGKAAVPFPTIEISARRNSINNKVRIRRYGPPIPSVPMDSPRQQ